MPVKPIQAAVFLVGVWFHYAGLAVQANVLPQAGLPLPATDREWFGEDYERVATAFTSGELALPRLKDKVGEALLLRLTSTDHLAFFRNKTLPIQPRMDDFLKLLPAVNTILKQYLAAANKREGVHEEICRVLVFLLRVSAAGVDLIDEFVPTIPRDETYAVRMDGLKKFNSGLTTQFVGAERSLSERNFYSSKDLSLLLDGMSSTLPTLKRAFPPGYAKELRDRLKYHLRTFTGVKDRKNIDRMIAELGAAAR